MFGGKLMVELRTNKTHAAATEKLNLHALPAGPPAKDTLPLETLASQVNPKRMT